MIQFSAIGDCCIDVYPQKNKSFLGGTAFNLCLQAQVSGAKASLISAVGNDTWGKKYLSACKKLNINGQHLAIIPGRTSHINITLDENKKPIFSQWQLGVLKNFSLNQARARFLKTQGVAVAVLYQPIARLFLSFAQLNLPQTLKVADFAGGSIYSPEVKILKTHAPKFDLIVKSDTDSKTIKLLKKLAVDYDKIVLVFMGQHGSWILTKKENFFHPSLKTSVKDTTGAGDAYLAAFLVEYFKTKQFPTAMKAGTQAATKVISRLGAHR